VLYALQPLRAAPKNTSRRRETRIIVGEECDRDPWSKSTNPVSRPKQQKTGWYFLSRHERKKEIINSKWHVGMKLHLSNAVPV